MSEQISHRKFRVSAFLGAAVFFVAPEVVFGIARGEPGRQQEARQTQAKAEAQAAGNAASAKVKKIWTEDDLIALRTPMDIYLLEKEAQEAAAAIAAKEAEARKPEKEVPAEMKLPGSVEETQLLISNREQEISEEQSTLSRLKGELGEAPAEEQAAKQKEIDVVSARLEKAQIVLKALQGQLEKLSAQQAETGPTPTPPPPL